jgi:DNA-binding GntR family transcriptional regulator
MCTPHSYPCFPRATQNLADPASSQDVTAPGQGASATQQVLHKLRSLIIRGDIVPGERLKVESLKALLQTGASPIREALSLLTSDQLVERIDHRGFRVAATSEEQFQEILMLRCQLEDIALRASIKQGDSAWEEQAVLAHHRLSKAPRANTEQWELLHKQFHKALLLACGSPILLKFCDQLYDLNIRYRFLAGKSEHYSRRDVTAEHAAILQAIINRNADKATSKLTQHYRRTGDFLSEKFNGFSHPTS